MSAFNSLSRDHLTALRYSFTDTDDVLSTPSLGITYSTLTAWVTASTPSFNSLSRDHTYLSRPGAGRGAVSGFQLPLSGSHPRPLLSGCAASDFQLPLSGSQQFFCKQCGFYHVDEAFNSLSRDHKNIESYGRKIEERISFQLPLSGSRRRRRQIDHH